ncbi:MAG TPA: glycosyl hydrolase [Conexibacter sp.]|jgi:hypothetical protein|nr:glycosyl hydrolase [Conexibacter sp.]
MSSQSSRARRLLSTLLVATSGLGLLAASSAAAATPHATPVALRTAAAQVTRADHALVVKASALKRCQRAQRRHPRRCTAQRRAVQRAGTQLARSERRLARLGRSTGSGLIARAAATVAAPTLTVSGQTLTWTKVNTIGSYVFVRKVSALADQYSVVNGTSTTPAVVPGKTVRFSVRANALGSTWAPEVSIAYPAAPALVDTTAAPTVAVSGQTLSWKAIGSVSAYIMATKVPGQVDQYSVVNGTSATPTAVPDATVSYSLRTDVDGSAWSTPVSIAYPAPAPAPAHAPTSFSMGVAAGSALSWELPFVQQVKAHTARMEFGIETSASSMAPEIDAYARAGIRPLLLATFYGRTPTTAEAQNLASWAAAYGPGGTFWQGKSYPANTAVTDIEFGNETSYSYQFSDNSTSTYTARAQAYAQRAKDAATAVAAANAKVGLVVQGDNAQQGTSWVQNMFKAVPALGSYVAGWSIHPYGPNWATRVDSTVNSTRTAGSPDRPIWVTEYGISSDNGRTLDDNYGWSTSMTYGEAATALHGVLTGMETRYGSRLGAFYLYDVHDLYATGTKSGREAYFGAIQLDKSPKGAYTTEVMADIAATP